MRSRHCTAALLALAMLAVAAPAAPAQSPLEVGRDKLAERVAAECRRAGVAGDETCWAGIGARVIRREVAEYGKTWVHRANKFQYRLGSAVPFKDAPWLGTHNSANDTAERATPSHTDSNQQLTLEQQLKLDMRSLEVDIHWTPSIHAAGQAAAVACHALGQDMMHAGCTTERLARERLAEIDAWLEAHRDEVILLYLEDHVGPAGYRTAGDEVAEIFKGQLYTGASGCQPLPLGLTRAAVHAAGKQVVIVSDCGGGAWAANVFSWKGGEGGVSDESGSPGPAGSGCPSADYANRLVRFYEDSTWVSATRSGGRGPGLTGPRVRELMACGTDLFGFDQLLPFDGRLEAAVWTWAGESAMPRPGDCAAQRADGRWEARSCARKHAPACVSATRVWTVLTTPLKHKAAAGACEDAGLALGTPRTSEENAALRAGAGDAVVWLGYSEPKAKKRPR